MVAQARKAASQVTPDSSVRRKDPAPTSNAPKTNKSAIEWLNAKRGAIDRVRKESRRDCRELIAEAYAEGIKLASAPEKKWATFLTDPFWKQFPKRRPMKDEQASAVEFVISWYEGDGVRASKSKSEIMSAIRWLQHEGRSEADIKKALAGKASLRKMADKWAEVQSEAKEVASAAKPKTSVPTRPAATKSGRGPAKVAKPSRPPSVMSGPVTVSGVTNLQAQLSFPKGLQAPTDLVRGTTITVTMSIELDGPTLLGAVSSWSVDTD